MLLRNLLLSFLLLSALPPAVLADRYGHRREQRGDDWERGNRQHNDDRGRRRELSLNDAVQMAQRRYNARVVRADAARDGDRTIYRLRLLSADGRVWTVTVDASSGAMR